MTENFEDDLTGTVEGQQNDTGDRGAKDQPAGPTREEFSQLNSRLTELLEENRHNRELLRQFTAKQNAPANDDLDDDAEEEVEGDIADDLAANGIEALRKRGVLTKREARELIREEAKKIAEETVNRSRAGMIADAKLAREYPDLADQRSPLFQRTQAIYQELVKDDPALGRSARTLPTAARLAKAELLAEGKLDARQDRINRQSGDRSSGRHVDFGDDEGDELTPNQREIIRRFNESGEVEISEDGYRKRATRVSMSGTGGRR